MNEEAEDLSSEYLSKTAGTDKANAVSEMEDWLKNQDATGNVSQTRAVLPQEVESRPLPEPKPPRQPSGDTIGRPDAGKEGTTGAIMRNIAEVPGQVVGGMHDAVTNALSFMNPLTNWLDDNVADLRYDPKDSIIGEPKTITGSVTRKLSEFLTGFVPALKGLKALGMTNAVTTPMAAGAIADFVVRDPHEGRLADLWNEMGLPKNVLTEYLKSDSTDGEVEARFKNSLEGAITGTALEGVMLAARTLRGALSVKGVRRTEDSILKAKYGEVGDEDFKIIGDPSKPSFRHVVVKPNKAGAVIADAAEDVAGMTRIRPNSLIRKKGADGPEPEDFDTYVNFAKIDTPDQVKFLIGKMADMFKGRIDDATRGEVSQKATQQMADDLGMTVPELLVRRKGQAFNAEEAVAARQLWAASGEKLLEVAKAAAKPNAGPIDHFNFRKMMATHAAIQDEVLGARAEAGRALASWAIPAGGTERARAIEQIMAAMGGPEASTTMAKRIAILAEYSDLTPAQIGKIAQKGFASNTADSIKELWVNGLLSSPKTHAVNITSNTLVMFQQIYERAAAGGIRTLTGGEGVQMGEAVAMTYGMVESVKDAFVMAAKALKTGETGWSFNKVDMPRVNAISSESYKMSKETGLGRFVDFLGTGARVPSRLLGAEDEFFKTIGYRMELRAQALRTASQEGHKGPELAARVQDILRNPPEHVQINAADAALYSTFTSDMGSFGKAVMNLRDTGGSMNPLLFVLPFVRTPVNIARYAFERSPFAPLVGQWRADIAAGGARSDLALARMSTGTAIMMTAMDFADKGLISGEGPKGGTDKDVREAMGRQGWQPYSVKVGDRWYSYNRTDPFGMTMGFAASIAEAVKKGEIDENDVDEWNEVAAMAIAAVSQVTINKTYLEGVSKFVEMMSDPKRHTQQYVDDTFASFLPMVAASNAVKNAVDPIQREANTPQEAVMARIAALSERLPPRRNLWGEPISSASGLGVINDAINPVASKAENVQPIDREIVRMDDGPTRIGKKTTFDGVQANFKLYPKAYDDYTRLAGNELKHPAFGMGAKDFLNAVVSGKHPISAAYQIMSDESRKDFIKNTISDYRKLAQRQVLQMPAHKGFAAEIQRLKEINQGAKMPVMTGE